MTAKLTLRYEFSSDPDDDFGWLAVSVQTDAFAGRGGFWVQWQNVTEMVPKLSAYPFSSAGPFVEEWGQCNGDGSNYEVIVGITILPANKTGDLDVIVRIADHIDTRRQCQAVFRTNYPDTANFARELKAVMDRQRDEAVLLGRSVRSPPIPVIASAAKQSRAARDPPNSRAASPLAPPFPCPTTNRYGYTLPAKKTAGGMCDRSRPTRPQSPARCVRWPPPPSLPRRARQERVSARCGAGGGGVASDRL